MRRHGSADLLVLLLWCGVAQGEVLYRCAGEQGPPRWQAQPCEPGEAQRTLEYAPQPATKPPPPPARPAARPRPASRSSSAPRRDQARERQAAACRDARSAARERSDSHGKRLPLRTIREREREAARACGH